MKLLEFFGRPVSVDKSTEKNNKNVDAEDLFFFIINNDDLHRENFFPIAKKIKKTHSLPEFDKSVCLQELMKMVKKGCKKYHEEKKLPGHLKDRFPKELRDELCEKLYDHYYDDIVKDNYNIGI